MAPATSATVSTPRKHVDHHEITVDPRRLPDPALPRPDVAWPTVWLFVLGVGLFGASTWLGVTGAVPVAVAVIVNAFAAYIFFTVLHEASHRAISKHRWIDTWLGRITAPFVGPPFSAYPVFRYIHMQHHRFTNEADGRDPDIYALSGPGWQLPLRWLTLDLHYWVYAGRIMPSRPRADRIEFLVSSLVFGGALAVLCVLGYWAEILLFLFLPSRLNQLWLGFAFNYLPHHGLTATPTEDPYKTTRNRVGLEWLITPLLLYQNYHLVHHLHPLIPFYRYISAWRRNEDRYVARGTPLASVGGNAVSPREYLEGRR